MKYRSAIFVLILSAVIAAAIIGNIFPLRPEGAPKGSRNLGNLLQQSYWIYCDSSIGDLIYCETYPRTGGEFISNGIYIKMSPSDYRIFRSMQEISPIEKFWDIFGNKINFIDGFYYFPVAERIRPVGVRQKWTYRYAIRDCASNLNNVGDFVSYYAEYADSSWEEHITALQSEFAEINLTLSSVEPGKLFVHDELDNIDGYLQEVNVNCFGRFYLGVSQTVN